MTPQMIQRILQVLDHDPETRGAPIGCYSGTACREVRRGDRWLRNSGRLTIILEEAPISGVQFGLPAARPQVSVVTRVPAATAARNSGSFGTELLGAGLNCTLAVFAGATVVGATAAEPMTGGASTPVLFMAYAGLWSAGTSCLQNIRRATEANINPDDNSLALEDSNTSAIAMNNFVDAVGVGSGFAEFGVGTRAVFDLLVNRAQLNRQAFQAALTGGNQAERRRLVREAVERARANPAIRRELAPLLHAAGYDLAHGVGSRAGAARVANLISEIAARRLSTALGQVIAPLLSGVVSAQRPGSLGSGSVRVTMDAIPGLLLHVVPRG